MSSRLASYWNQHTWPGCQPVRRRPFVSTPFFLLPLGFPPPLVHGHCLCRLQVLVESYRWMYSLNSAETGLLLLISQRSLVNSVFCAWQLDPQVHPPSGNLEHPQSGYCRNLPHLTPGSHPVKVNGTLQVMAFIVTAASDRVERLFVQGFEGFIWWGVQNQRKTNYYIVENPVNVKICLEFNFTLEETRILETS